MASAMAKVEEAAEEVVEEVMGKTGISSDDLIRINITF